jgi:acetyl esterase/lipase
VGGAITNWMKDSWLIASTNRVAQERFREIMTANPHNMTRTSQNSRSPSRPAAGRLGEIQVPTLIIVGESDMPDVHAHCGAIQAGIANSRRIVVPGASHFVHLERPAEFNQLVTRFLMSSGKPKDLVYYTPEMERAVIRSNLTYKAIDGTPLGMDAYLPPTARPGARRPALIFMLGDAAPEALRNAKDWTFMQSYGRLAAVSGFIGITFNHRSSENFTKLPEVRADIDDLIRHVRTNAAALAIDPERICLWFFSGSGVHLESGLGTNASFVRCIVGYYPLLAPSRRIPMSDALRGQFSALEQIKRHSGKIPPLLLVRAGLDSLSLNQSLDEFRQQATASGVALEMLEHPSGEHAFDIRNDDDTSRDIIRRTLDFVKQHLQ